MEHPWKEERKVDYLSTIRWCSRTSQTFVWGPLASLVMQKERCVRGTLVGSNVPRILTTRETVTPTPHHHGVLLEVDEVEELGDLISCHGWRIITIIVVVLHAQQRFCRQVSRSTPVGETKHREIMPSSSSTISPQRPAPTERRQ